MVELSAFKDDAYLRVLRPLVEAYLAVWRESNRHIKSLHLTPSQFDVVATLGDTDGMTCTELSAATLVTKGTLTGVIDRLIQKGLIRRERLARDRRTVRVRLTEQGDAVFEKTFRSHTAFLRPFFERALSKKEADDLCRLLRRIRNSFQSPTQGRS